MEGQCYALVLDDAEAYPDARTGEAGSPQYKHAERHRDGAVADAFGLG